MTSGTEEQASVELGDQEVVRGQGGETHQAAEPDGRILTTQQGIPVADDQNTLAGRRAGPAALEDFHFREKIFHFDHERIPERVVHARGFGAKGYFECYEPLTELTRADLFSEAGKRTEAFVRFSTVAGNKGSFDLARDVRGFAVKLYTQEGNWDLVGNNIPVFFIQDAIKFPDLIHAAKQEADRGFPQAQTAHDTFWDFVSLMPESTHMLMWIMSDRTIPRSFRTMEGFGVHTFRLVNADGVSTFVKFHWKPKAGLQSVVWNEAVKINGADPDFHRRDLWDAIQSGNFPEWELGVQVFDEAFADAFDFDVLDATKIIPEEQVPIRLVGRLVLDQTVDNFFAETEQVAFCTQNVPPGIDFTNDPLLQGRNFSYLDTQLKRLGSPNFTFLPVNAPRCPFATLPAGRAHGDVQPDRPQQLRAELARAARRGPRIAGDRLPDLPGRRAGREAATATGELRRPLQPGPPVLPEPDRHRAGPHRRCLHVRAEQGRDAGHPARMVAGLRNVDEALAQTVADGLGLTELPHPLPAAAPTRDDLTESPALSIVLNGPDSFAGRKVGILVSDDADADLLPASRLPSTPRARSTSSWRRRLAASPFRMALPSWRTSRSRAARRCSTTPPSCSCQTTAPRSSPSSRRRRTGWPMPTPTPSSSGTRLPPRHCSTPPASPPSWMTASSTSRSRAAQSGSSSAVATCGTGNGSDRSADTRRSGWHACSGSRR